MKNSNRYQIKNRNNRFNRSSQVNQKKLSREVIFKSNLSLKQEVDLPCLGFKVLVLFKQARFKLKKVMSFQPIPKMSSIQNTIFTCHCVTMYLKKKELQQLKKQLTHQIIIKYARSTFSVYPVHQQYTKFTNYRKN